MKKINLITLMLAVFTISVNAQFKVGLDYRIVANPLPVKKDGCLLYTSPSPRDNR